MPGEKVGAEVFQHFGLGVPPPGPSNPQEEGQEEDFEEVEEEEEMEHDEDEEVEMLCPHTPPEPPPQAKAMPQSKARSHTCISASMFIMIILV